MASSDFLSFAGGSGANVLSQADYAALAALATGFSAGVAQSAQVNKVLRQSSIMSAVLAQFICDRTGQNVVDDGTTVAILAQLKSSAAAVSGDATKTFAVAPATQPQHAVQFSQISGVVGSARNVAMSVSSASASATLTADEIIVESALGGLRYCLASFNKTVNLATTGAGGMDAGSPPSSGFAALYAIYNPTTQTSALLAANATSAVAPNIYGGANMPSGFTASALVAVLPVASSQFAPCTLVDRTVTLSASAAFSTINTGASYASFSVASQVPLNAKKVLIGAGATNNTTGAAMIFYIASNSAGIGVLQCAYGYSGANVGLIIYGELPIPTGQTLYWKASNSTGNPTYTVYVNNYTF